MKLTKKHVNIITISIWNNLQLDFYNIFDEVYSYMSLLSDKKMSNTVTQRVIILNNIINQQQLRNVIVDGMILSDLNYAEKFFNTNLYLLINKHLFNMFPQYKFTIYKYINNTLYKVFPDQYIDIILQQISNKLKLWLVDSCNKELSQINKNVIYLK